MRKINKYIEKEGEGREREKKRGKEEKKEKDILKTFIDLMKII